MVTHSISLLEFCLFEGVVQADCIFSQRFVVHQQHINEINVGRQELISVDPSTQYVIKYGSNNFFTF